LQGNCRCCFGSGDGVASVDMVADIFRLCRAGSGMRV
jgi:hypothetical protein